MSRGYTNCSRERDPARMTILLQRIREIDARMDAVPATKVSGVPGRKPEHALRATSPEARRELRAIRAHRAKLLEELAAAGLPAERWTRHGRRLLYLAPLPELDAGPESYELYELPVRASKWIPAGVPEAPSVTERRIAYARQHARGRLALTGLYAGLSLWIWTAWCAYTTFVAGAEYPGLLAILLISAALVGALVMAGSYHVVEKAGFTKIDEDYPRSPFEEIAPGTGEPSERLQHERERLKDRQWKRHLNSIAPECNSVMCKTRDYDYEYAGYHPGAESTCRVRIYESQDGRSEAPVIVLTQPLPPSGTSLTNLIEAIAAEVVVTNLDHRLPSNAWADRLARRRPPFRVVEHYSKGYPDWFDYEGDRAGEHFAIVAFSSYRVQAPESFPPVENLELGGEQWTVVVGNASDRPRLGAPRWHHVGRIACERLVGQKL